MKIMMDDNISTIDSDNLSSYLGDNSEHKPELVLNDYPTAQWISSFPDLDSVTGEQYTSVLDTQGNATGRLRIQSTLRAYGSTSLNGIYLGQFNGDAINYEVSKVTGQAPRVDSNGDPVTDSNGVQLTDPVYTSIGEKVVPMRVFSSFGHFVRGVPRIYSDYLYTLEDLGFKTEDHYISSGFEIKTTLFAEIDRMASTTVSFDIDKVTKLTHTDQNGARKFWKIMGAFKENGVCLRYDSPSFSEDIHVGMTVLLNLDGDNKLTDGTQATRVAQIVEIVGDGARDCAVSLLIRSYEDSGVEEPFEDLLANDGVTFVSSVVLNTTVEEANFSKNCKINYLFTSMRMGLFRAGYIENFPNPQVGLSRSYKDFSIRKSLVNGGHQYSNRNIAKIYSGSLVLDRDRVRRFLTFAEIQRAKPFPVEVITNMESETPTVFYGFFNNSPSESLNQRTGVIRDVNFSIQQVF